MNGRLVRRARRLAALLGVSGGIGAALLAAAAVLAASLLWPQMQRNAALAGELAGLEQRLAGKVPGAAAQTPEQQLAQFRAALPRQGAVNGLIEKLHELAAGHQLALRNGEYRALPAAGGLGRLQVSFKTVGSYADLRAFLGEAQAQMPSLALGRSTLARARIADTALEAALEFQLLYATE